MIPETETTDTLNSILSVLEDIKASQKAAEFALESYAYQEAALLPGQVVEQGSVVSGQQTSKITPSATKTLIEAQTGDLEIIEGIYVTVTDLSSGGIVGASLQLTDRLSFPFTLQAGQPQVILSPVRIPVSETTRLLSVVSVSGTYTSVNCVMWGHVAPARTRTVH